MEGGLPVYLVGTETALEVLASSTAEIEEIEAALEVVLAVLEPTERSKN